MAHLEDAVATWPKINVAFYTEDSGTDILNFQ